MAVPDQPFLYSHCRTKKAKARQYGAVTEAEFLGTHTDSGRKHHTDDTLIQAPEHRPSQPALNSSK
ncbi:hypothetical protein N7471_003150 [Penicillium samsonianum]|uniref:uncharacterized protein n=1 Tax=Penicillium samsonianum TaxID=1882272 RepID=UPI00254865C2|nr:uncharacterized protein N7471_003150 [Penicillium samsonianum]KAJ6143697.1 hypothetical protein N7471_003150 [Penicillium samsonianum]